MGNGSELQVVLFIPEIIIISGDDVCCSVVFGWCVSVMWSELLMASAIGCPL